MRYYVLINQTTKETLKASTSGVMSLITGVYTDSDSFQKLKFLGNSGNYMREEVTPSHAVIDQHGHEIAYFLQDDYAEVAKLTFYDGDRLVQLNHVGVVQDYVKDIKPLSSRSKMLEISPVIAHDYVITKEEFLSEINYSVHKISEQKRLQYGFTNHSGALAFITGLNEGLPTNDAYELSKTVSRLLIGYKSEI